MFRSSRHLCQRLEVRVRASRHVLAFARIMVDGTGMVFRAVMNVRYL
jgi:hypothetical protein